MPPPTPVADVVSAPETIDAVAADAVATAEVDAGPTVAQVEPRPKVVEPRVAAPKVVEPRVVEPKVDAKKAVEPKVIEPKVVEPKVDPKKVVEPKVEDPKLKGPVDQALADAKAHLDGGRWAEAKSGYEKALALSPGNTRAVLGRGRALLELRQVQPALKDIKAVLEVEPRNPTALLLAGSISQELGQKDQARGYYQRYLDAWPSGRKADRGQGAARASVNQQSPPPPHPQRPLRGSPTGDPGTSRRESGQAERGLGPRPTARPD